MLFFDPSILESLGEKKAKTEGFSKSALSRVVKIVLSAFLLVRGLPQSPQLSLKIRDKSLY